MEKRSAKERASKKSPEHKTSENQRPKDALPESEALYKHLADALPDPVVILQDDRYQFVNPAFTRLFGYTRQDLDRGLSFLETIQEQDKRAARQRYEKRLAGKQLSKINTIDLIAKDGTLVPCETSAAMIQYQGRPADLVIIRDITERVQAKARVTEQNEFLSSAIEALAHPFYVIDANDYTIKMANTATGFGPELASQTCYALTHGRTVPCEGSEHPCPLREAKRTKESVIVEHIHYDEEGNPRVFEIHGYPILDAEGNVIQLIEYSLDITERKQAEAALHKSEKQASAAIEAARAFTFNYDIATGKIEWGGAIKEITGYAPIEFAQVDIDGWVEMIHPDDKDGVLSILQEAIQKKDRATAEYRFRTKKGGYVMLSSISLTEKKDGKAVRLVGILQDITERKQAEEALRKNEEKYRSLFENMLEGFAYCKIILDVTGRPVDFMYLDVNEAFEKLTGLKREDVLGRRVTDAIPGILESHPELFEIYGNVALTGEATAFELFFEPLKIWLSISVYCPHEGHFVAVFNNITERRQAEEALRESEKQASAAIEAARAFTFNYDIATGKIEWGGAIKEITGYAPIEFAQVDIDGWVEMIHPDDKDGVLSILQEAIQKKDRATAEYRFRTKKGGYVMLSSISLTEKKDGKAVRLVGILQDITERKQAEEALRETTDELRAEREELSEKNLVLRHILEHIEEERQEYKQQICQDVEQAVIPVLKQLQKGIEAAHAGDFEGLEANLKAILAKDVDVFRERYAKLTPRELEICDMIKEGLSSKEISESLNLSILTVHKHREDVRKKLGITNKNVNLGTYLRVR